MHSGDASDDGPRDPGRRRCCSATAAARWSTSTPVEHLLLRVAQLKNDLPQVRSLELTLVLVGADGATVLNARRPGRAGRRRPLRLVRPPAVHPGRGHPVRGDRA